MLRGFIPWYSELKLLDGLAVSLFIGLLITAVAVMTGMSGR